MKLTREKIMADHEKRTRETLRAVPVLQEQVKALQAEVEALQARIALLEARPVVPNYDSTWHDPTIWYGPHVLDTHPRT